MSDKCGVCVKTIGNRQSKMQCLDCKKYFHGSCLQMSKEDVDFLVANNEVWRCESCSQSRRKSMQLESHLNKEPVDISDVYKFLQEMRDESNRHIKNLELELGKSVELCHSKIEDLNKKIDAQSETIRSYQESIQVLKKENFELTKKCKHLEIRLDDQEQYSRLNCLEINGVPEQKNEDVSQIVQKIGASIGTDIDEKDIDTCHRLGVPKSENAGRPRGIIVKFTRRVLKEDFLQKRRVKRNLNTKDIGFVDRPADVVYVNESLSEGRRRVFNAARALKKENRLQYVWVRNGKVLTRAEDGARVVAVTTMEQVAALSGTPYSQSRAPTAPTETTLPLEKE